MQLIIRPLTADLWPALEALFADSPICQRCWCMYWRIGAAYREQRNAVNLAAFRRVVRKGPPPGLIALDEGIAIGWCQLTPRSALPQLSREWRLKTIDQQPVWAISCFYVRKSHRRQGVSTALIAAAIDTARCARAPALEAYPFDRAVSPSSTSTGFASTFVRMGFHVVACHIAARPIMRHDLRV